jgi:hypothetical protein
MSCLPAHGRVNCRRCFDQAHAVGFDATRREAPDGRWRITWNPLSWGNDDAEIVVLGFSKGPTQAGALASSPHEETACKGSRTAVGKILAHVRAIPVAADGDYWGVVDRLIAERQGRFHFGSLVRCTVERFDEKRRAWLGSGGGILDRFVAAELGKEVAINCATRFLRDLSAKTKLVTMFGLGRKLNYVRETRKLMETVRPGPWRAINEVAYADTRTTFVHVEHFASQGALIPNWLGRNDSERRTLGEKAREAVETALA